MRDVVKTLLNRQRDGKITNFGNLARDVHKTVTATIAELAMAEYEKEIRVGYWSGTTPTGKLYAIPSVKTMEEIPQIPIEELVWPELTNELLTSNFAARIWVFNVYNPFDLEEYPTHNILWAEQMSYLYENLALTVFGSRESWVLEKGLLTGLALQELTRMPQKKIFKRNTGTRSATLVCRYCGKSISDPMGVIRGLHSHCCIEIEHLTGTASGQLTNALIITDEKLDELIASIRPQRLVLTEQQAAERCPNGYINLKDLIAKAKAQGISISRVVRAIGGDRGLGPIHSELWRQFCIGRVRYVDIGVLDELTEIR